MNWLPEEDFQGLSDDFFDDLINHMDFPLENIDVDEDWDARFQDLEPPPMDMFSSLPSEFTSCGIRKTALKQSSSSEASSDIANKVPKLFQSSSPVSVLETSDGSFLPQDSRSQRLTFPVKGMRSKRKRSTTPRFRCSFPFELSKPEQLTLGETDSESYYSSEQHTKKKRKIQLTTHTLCSSLETRNFDGMIVRKCTHCETTKTPQWREGPNGPKTLCNACGVRFRSGRLVPEYRPASSPTFIPSLHSNSHRKIIEMRRKDDDQFDTSMIHAVISRA